MKRIVFGLTICWVMLVSCELGDDQAWKQEVQNADFLHRSIRQVTDVIVHDIFSPPVASRIYAYVSIAGYEAAIQGDPNYRSYSGQLTGLDSIPQPQAGLEYCYQLASVQATLKVGRALVFSEDKMDGFYNSIMQEFKDTNIPDEVYERSIEYGTKVAERVIKWYGKDNYKQSRSFPKYSIVEDPSTW